VKKGEIQIASTPSDGDIFASAGDADQIADAVAVGVLKERG
jgi:hypothetical protein